MGKENSNDDKCKIAAASKNNEEEDEATCQATAKEGSGSSSINNKASQNASVDDETIKAIAKHYRHGGSTSLEHEEERGDGNGADSNEDLQNGKEEMQERYANGVIVRSNF